MKPCRHCTINLEAAAFAIFIVSAVTSHLPLQLGSGGSKRSETVLDLFHKKLRSFERREMTASRYLLPIEKARIDPLSPGARHGSKVVQKQTDSHRNIDATGIVPPAGRLRLFEIESTGRGRSIREPVPPSFLRMRGFSPGLPGPSFLLSTAITCSESFIRRALPFAGCASMSRFSRFISKSSFTLRPYCLLRRAASACRTSSPCAGFCLSGKGRMGRSLLAFTLKSMQSCLRSSRRCLAPRLVLSFGVVARCLDPRFLRSLARSWRRQLYPGASGLRQPDRNRLFCGTGAVRAFLHMLNLFANKLPGLR